MAQHANWHTRVPRKRCCLLLLRCHARNGLALLPPDYGSLVADALYYRLGARRVLCYRLDQCHGTSEPEKSSARMCVLCSLVGTVALVTG